MKRILVTGYVPGANGIATCVHNLYRQLDRTRFDWVFLIREEYRQRAADLAPLRELGGELHFLEYSKSYFPKESRQRLKSLLAEIPDLCGVHLQATDLNIYPIILARELGLPVRVIQYHSPANRERIAAQNAGKDARLAARRRRVAGEDVCRLACSDLSGEYGYGSLPFRVFPNAVDLSRFFYSPLYGQILRKKLGIPDGATILGFAAIFSSYKNPLFAAEVFAAYHRRDPGAHMLLCGRGALRGEVYAFFEREGLLPFAHFVGEQPQIELFMNAMDLFLAPSDWEGLPNALVEAQATGLPCLISDTISEMASITPLVRRLPVGAGPEAWVDAAFEVLSGYRRRTFADEIIRAGYDIESAAEELMRIYAEQISG